MKTKKKRTPKSKKYQFRIILALEVTARSNRAASEAVEALATALTSAAPLKLTIEDVESLSEGD